MYKKTKAMELRLNGPLIRNFKYIHAFPEEVDLETALEYYSGNPHRYIGMTNSCKAFADYKQIEFSQRTSILMGRTAYYIKIDLTICWISEELVNILAGIRKHKKKILRCSYKDCDCSKGSYGYKEMAFGYISCIVKYALPKF